MRSVHRARGLWSGTTVALKNLDMEGGDAEFLALLGNVLGSQHGGVGARLVTISLDLHAPVRRQMVSRPVRSVTWIKVSLKEA